MHIQDSMVKKLLIFLVFIINLDAFGQFCPEKIHISLSQELPICEGSYLELTADPNFDSADFIYQWFVNGKKVGTDSKNYSSENFSNEDKVWVEISSSQSSFCKTTSNEIVIDVSPVLIGQIKIQASQTRICQDESVIFSIASSNINAADYFWQINGVTNQKGNSFTTSKLEKNDKIELYIVPTNTCISPFFSNPIVILEKDNIPKSPTEVYGPQELCEGETAIFSTPEVEGATEYVWNLPLGWKGRSSGSSIEVVAGRTYGNISVRALNACGSSLEKNLPVTVIPGLSGEITGPDTVCPNVPVIYYVDDIEDSELTWSLPEGWTGNSNSGSIEVIPGSTGGELKVQKKSLCGTIDELTLAVDISPPILELPEISGLKEVCTGEEITYSITPVQGVTSYTWKIPKGWSFVQNNNSAEVIVIAGEEAKSGKISMTAMNNCGEGPKNQMNVYVKQTNFPETISGPSELCGFLKTLTYTVPKATENIDYHWSFPRGWKVLSGQGTNMVQVASFFTQGDIKLTINNECGEKTILKKISVSHQAPHLPEKIFSTAGTNLCPPEEIRFAILPVFGATGYHWTLPKGFNIIKGENTREVTVKIDASASFSKSENISVYAFNSCGSSRSRTFKIGIEDYVRVDLGDDLTVCKNIEQIEITGILDYPGGVIPELTTDGSGTFSEYTQGNTTRFITTYKPSKKDIEAGSVVIKLETNTPPGACGPGMDEMKITFQENKTIQEYFNFEVETLPEVNCGVHSTQLKVKVIPLLATPGMEKKISWQWAVLSGQSKDTYNLTDLALGTTGFSAKAGNYQLEWKATHPYLCGEIKGTIEVNFSDCSNLDFDGRDDQIVLSSPFNEARAWELWIRPKKKRGIIFSNKNSAGDGYQFELQNGKPVFSWKNGKLESPYELQTNSRWYHLAVSFHDNFAFLYIDGFPVKQVQRKRITESNEDLVIGTRTVKPLFGKNFSGWMDEFRIWNRGIRINDIRFFMNQRLNPIGPFLGSEINMDSPGNLGLRDLDGYYQMNKDSLHNGSLKDLSGNSRHGRLKNMTTNQENSAPIPYISKADGKWTENTTWAHPDVWVPPNSLGVTGEKITWNIVKVRHNITSEANDINILGLISEENKLIIASPNPPLNEKNTGQLLHISHYLKLDGKIDLVGESQLIQDIGSIIDVTSTGYIERDQQGRSSSFNYNYWSSPVSSKPENPGYTIAAVMKDGTNPEKIIDLSFGDPYWYADGAPAIPRKISNFWLNVFHGPASDYASWKHIGSKTKIKIAEGYSMKGTTGTAGLNDKQNYTFKGIPNNGDIRLSIGARQNYLIGNPYPSSLDANEFIMDNLAMRRDGRNIINGTLYFWSHFAGSSHYLQEYIGGYATYNLSGGIRAISNDERINANDSVGGKIPQRYIPVGQGFFVNTVLPNELNTPGAPNTVPGGEILFRNSQRIYRKELDENGDGKNDAVFHLQVRKKQQNRISENSRKQIWINFSSPLKYYREILVTADTNATDGFDLGYDAPLIENNEEDMYWLLGANPFVIQGVQNFESEKELKLGIKIKKKGNFSIGIQELKNIPAHLQIYLKDSLLKVTHNLRNEPYYTESEAGTFQNRFRIVFKEEPEPEFQTDDENENLFEVFYFNQKKEILIKNPHLLAINKIFLHNMLGQHVHSYHNIPNQNLVRLPINKFGTGVYIVKVYSEKGATARKIIVE